MYYTYVLRCSDGDFYVGSRINLRDRFAWHEAGRVPATARIDGRWSWSITRRVVPKLTLAAGRSSSRLDSAELI